MENLRVGDMVEVFCLFMRFRISNPKWSLSRVFLETCSLTDALYPSEPDSGSSKRRWRWRFDIHQERRTVSQGASYGNSFPTPEGTRQLKNKVWKYHGTIWKRRASGCVCLHFCSEPNFAHLLMTPPRWIDSVLGITVPGLSTFFPGTFVEQTGASDCIRNVTAVMETKWF